RRAHDDRVFENRPGRARADAEPVRGLIQALAQINASVRAEGRNGLAGFLVQGVEETTVADKDPVLVDRHATVAKPRRRGGAAAWIELPDLSAGGRIERDHLQRRRRRIQHAVDDDRIALHFRGLERVVRVVRPRDLKPADVLWSDLTERRVPDVVDAAVDG